MATELELLQAEEKRLEIEERKLAIEARKLENARLVREADKHRMDQETKETRDRQKGQALDSQKMAKRFENIRKTCTHQMGGKGREAFIQGRGNDPQSACTKTKLPTGDIVVRCQRCRTVWAPAWDAQYWRGKDGKFLPVDITASKTQAELKALGAKFDKAAFDAAVAEYDRAFNFRIDLATAVMPQYRWARGGKPINREVTYRFVDSMR